MRPPNWFVTSLQSFDPLLTVRWGDEIGAWVIERKASIPESELGYLINREARLRYTVQFPEKRAKHFQVFQNVVEEVVSARRGKRVIMIVKNLTNQVFTNLMLADIQRYGGYSRYADELEAREAKAESDRQRMKDSENHAMNMEVADMMHFMWRKREDALLNGHRNMNYLLHGKESNKPLIRIAE